jgi:Na+-driven multidrug efflux pump
MWGVRVVLTPILLLRAHMGLAGVWAAMVLDLIFRGILCHVLTKRLFARLEKWAG